LAIAQQGMVLGLCILGVDRFLDMCRTALNVTGDLATAVVVARGETAAEASPRPAWALVRCGRPASGSRSWTSAPVATPSR